MIKSSHQQTGVVLVFSLLILLLVTLLGVNMVQQNRVQFLMAANAQQSSNSFASAEDVLRLAEEYINNKRYEVWPLVGDPKGVYPNSRYTCRKKVNKPLLIYQIPPKDITNLLSLSPAITAKASIKVEILSTSCLIKEICNPPSKGKKYCSKMLTTPPPPPPLLPLRYPIAHSTEIYEVQVTINNNSGSKQILKSKYAVRCDL